MIRPFITVISLSACVVPHPHVLYTAASGAALICDVIAGTIRHCQEAPRGTPPKTEGHSVTPLPAPEPEHP